MPRELGGGLLGAAVANHAGMAEPPARDAGEPDVDQQVLEALTSWLLGGSDSSPPDELVWHSEAAPKVDDRPTPTANERTMTHLVEIATGIDIDRTGLVVVGDSADDFALARLWQLTFGRACWLPSARIGVAQLGTSEKIMPGPQQQAELVLGHRVARLLLAVAELPHPRTPASGPAWSQNRCSNASTASTTTGGHHRRRHCATGTCSRRRHAPGQSKPSRP